MLFCGGAKYGMENQEGCKRLLSLLYAYIFFQKMVGTPRAKKWIAENFWRAATVEKVVDIGCGPGIALHYLPQDIEYVGFDISEKYIETAQRVHAGKKYATFLQASVHSLLETHDDRLANSDLVICSGLLHHLNDDETIEVFLLAREILKPGCRLVCTEPVFTVHQSAFSRWLMSKDRGCNIRTEQQYKDLLSKVFDRYSTNIGLGLIRIPYVHIFLEAWADPK